MARDARAHARVRLQGLPRHAAACRTVRSDTAVYGPASNAVVRSAAQLPHCLSRLQAKFNAVYNTVTRSNNNDWLRRKLLEGTRRLRLLDVHDLRSSHRCNSGANETLVA